MIPRAASAQFKTVRLFQSENRFRGERIGLGLLWMVILVLGCSDAAPPIENSAGANPAPASAPRTGPPNVILVTLDTTRADALGTYGQSRPASPVVDALASGGVLFEQVSTSNPETLPSHATILTGLWPFSHGVRANSGYVMSATNETLAEILLQKGYRTAAEISARVLRASTLIDQGFEEFRGADDPTARMKEVFFVDEAGGKRSTNTRVGEDISQRGIEFIRRNQKRPFFLWLHYFDAHAPYSAPGKFNSQIPDSRYHAEVAHEDDALGRVVAEVKRLGLVEETLFVITADHGEGMNEHGEQSHSYGIYETTMRVPLVLAGLPDLPKGSRIRWPVRTVDIAPTVLEILGFKNNQGMQGESLVPLIKDPNHSLDLTGYGESTRFATTFGLPVIRFIRQGRWKYIHKVSPELYDLDADPNETRNLIGTEPQKAAELRERLKALLEEEAGAAPEDSIVEVDPNTEAELKVLGYLAHEAISLDANHESLDLWGEDTNGALPDANRLSEIRGLLMRKQFANASEILTPILQRYPESTVVLDMETTIQHGLGNDDAAFKALTRILELSPCDKKARTNALGLLSRQKLDQRTPDTLRRAADACPEDLELLNEYAWLLATSPRTDFRNGEKAVYFSELAVAGSDSPSLPHLDTLACALAEKGDFPEAIQVTEENLARARSEKEPAFVLDLLESRLASFKSNQAIRQEEPSDQQND